MTIPVPRSIDAVAEILRLPAGSCLPLHLGGWLTHIPGIPARVSAYVVRLRDSWGKVLWELGDDKEFSGAGRVFAAVLQGLYDGHRQRACLLPATSATVLAEGRIFRGTDDEQWGQRCEAKRRVFRKLGMTQAFAVRPEEVGEEDPSSTLAEYWWCPKQRLSAALVESWWMGFEGYIVPRSQASLLRSCFAPDPIATVCCLASQCHLLFQCFGEGEQLLILSQSVSLEELNGVLASRPVRRAVDELTKVARFTEWATVDRGSGWRWEQKK